MVNNISTSMVNNISRIVLHLFYIFLNWISIITINLSKTISNLVTNTLKLFTHVYKMIANNNTDLFLTEFLQETHEGLAHLNKQCPKINAPTPTWGVSSGSTCTPFKTDNNIMLIRGHVYVYQRSQTLEQKSHVCKIITKQ